MYCCKIYESTLDIILNVFVSFYEQSFCVNILYCNRFEKKNEKTVQYVNDTSQELYNTLCTEYQLQQKKVAQQRNIEKTMN